MCKLTAKEEEIMSFFWEKGASFVREIVDGYAEPNPHFNTISTIVRTLEEKGFLSHNFSIILSFRPKNSEKGSCRVS